MTTRLVRRRTNRNRQGFYIEMPIDKHNALVKWRLSNKKRAKAAIKAKEESISEMTTEQLLKKLGY
jgi:hypothetical protein